MNESLQPKMTLELKNRLQYGLAAAVAVLTTLIFLGELMTLLMSLICALQGWREYARMMDIKHRVLYYYAGFPMIVAMFAWAYFYRDLSLFWVWALWAVGFFLLFIDHRFRKKDNEFAELDPLGEWTALCRFVLGVMYIFLIFGFITPIAGKAGIGVELIILGFSVVFIGDTGAYFCGRRYGKTKLWPEISPKKTVEGALGGLVSSIASAIVVWALFKFVRGYHAPVSLGMCVLVAVVGAPLAQAADFLESLMKRAANRKDSGTLIPGHGGILDRADGLAFFLPFLYYLF